VKEESTPGVAEAWRAAESGKPSLESVFIVRDWGVIGNICNVFDEIQICSNLCQSNVVAIHRFQKKPDMQIVTLKPRMIKK